MAEILIVEDELSINELIRRNLSFTGHHCSQAFDVLGQYISWDTDWRVMNEKRFFSLRWFSLSHFLIR